MNLLKCLLRKKKKRRYTVSDFEEAHIKGYKHCISEVRYNPDSSIRAVTGVVQCKEDRVFVTWDAGGRAFVVRERDAKFDLLFKQ